MVELVTERYKLMGEKLPAKQIANLQRSPEFLRQCEDIYADGYKDWAILMAVWNTFFSVELGQIAANDYRPETMSLAVRSFADKKLTKALPVQNFLGAAFLRQLAGYESTVLMSLGFHPRVRRQYPKTVHRFLLDRMRLYEYDLPHDPLFMSPPGKWPFLEKSDSKTK